MIEEEKEIAFEEEAVNVVNLVHVPIKHTRVENPLNKCIYFGKLHEFKYGLRIQTVVDGLDSKSNSYIGRIWK